MPSTIYRQAVCWYCDGLFNRHEQDHAPIPKSCGGEATVTACTFCHRLKDMICPDAGLLNDRKEQTSQGGKQWYASTVRTVEKSLGV